MSRRPGIVLDFLLNGGPIAALDSPPNVVIILVDDQGNYDLGCYHGSEGALAAVRWDRWKLHLSPSLQLYDLAADPGETQPVRNAEVMRKLRGMAVLFQAEMRTGARSAGEAPP